MRYSKDGFLNIKIAAMLNDEYEDLRLNWGSFIEYTGCVMEPASTPASGIIPGWSSQTPPSGMLPGYRLSSQYGKLNVIPPPKSSDVVTSMWKNCPTERGII